MSISHQDISIRALKSSDIPRVSELHRELLQYPYPTSFFRQFLIHSSRICLVATTTTTPNTIIAFVSASTQTPTTDLSSPPRQDPQVEILTLGVIPEYRRRGIGKKLLLTAVHDLQQSESTRKPISVSAQVPSTLTGVQDFFRSLGIDEDKDIVGDLYRSLSSRYKHGCAVVGRMSIV